jgi:hypothetical protein
MKLICNFYKKVRIYYFYRYQYVNLFQLYMVNVYYGHK